MTGPANTSLRPGALAVVGGDGALRASIVEGLGDQGRFPVVALDGGYDLREAADTALAGCGPLSAVVLLCGDDEVFAPMPVAEMDLTQWDLLGERLMREVLFTLQAAHRAFTGREAGRIVLVLPTVGITGAPGLVPAATAVEGIRALAKSAARQWAAAGITVNCVLLGLGAMAPGAGDATSFVTPPALGRLPSSADVVTAIRVFTGPQGTGITGATLVVDGGSVMAP